MYFRSAVFEPTFQKHANAACGGCQVHVTDRATFRAVETGVALLEAFRAADPDRFGWKQPPYEYEYERLPIDLLAGSSQLREQIEAGAPSAEIARSWEAPVRAFGAIRDRFLLY